MVFASPAADFCGFADWITMDQHAQLRYEDKPEMAPGRGSLAAGAQGQAE
jgi:hypothetical protein